MGDSLIKFSVPASLETLNLSQEKKNLLEHVGLPLIHSSHSERFLPFTFFPSTTVQGKNFYLLGDIGSVAMGINFIGLEKRVERFLVFGYITKMTVVVLSLIKAYINTYYA